MERARLAVAERAASAAVLLVEEMLSKGSFQEGHAEAVAAELAELRLGEV